MTPRPDCPASQFGCSCSGRCAASTTIDLDKYQAKIMACSRAYIITASLMILSLFAGLAAVALADADRQLEIEARV